MYILATTSFRLSTTNILRPSNHLKVREVERKLVHFLGNQKEQENEKFAVDLHGAFKEASEGLRFRGFRHQLGDILECH
jgi:hypothetical protein